MKCKKCDTEISNNVKFCPKCGTPVGQENKNSKMLYGAIAVLSCIVVILAGILIFTKVIPSTQTFKNTNGEIISEEEYVKKVDDLEQEIEENPEDTAAYENLYNLYQQNQKEEEMQKLIEEMRKRLSEEKQKEIEKDIGIVIIPTPTPTPTTYTVTITLKDATVKATVDGKEVSATEKDGKQVFTVDTGKELKIVPTSTNDGTITVKQGDTELKASSDGSYTITVDEDKTVTITSTKEDTKKDETTTYAFEMTPIAYKDKGYIVKLNGKYGVIDTSGKWLIEAQYDGLVLSIDDSTQALTYGLLKTAGDYSNVLSMDEQLGGTSYSVKVNAVEDTSTHVYIDSSNKPYYYTTKTVTTETPSSSSNTTSDQNTTTGEETTGDGTTTDTTTGEDTNTSGNTTSDNGSSTTTTTTTEEVKETDLSKLNSSQYKNFFLFKESDTTSGTPYIYLQDGTVLSGYNGSEIMSIYRKMSKFQSAGEYGLSQNVYGNSYNTPIKGLLYAVENGKYRIYDVDNNKKSDELYDKAEVISDNQIKVVKDNTTYILGSNLEVKYKSTDYSDISCPVGNKVFVKKDGKWILIDNK